MKILLIIIAAFLVLFFVSFLFLILAISEMYNPGDEDYE